MTGSTPCDSCHAGCCRAFAVPITGADALRLQRTGLSFWDFAVRWSDRSGEIARRYAPHLFFEDTGDEPFVLGLMHTDSAVHPGTSKCRFLHETGPSADFPLGRGECSLYGDRPATCRVFPTKFDANRELVQLETIPPNGRPSDPQPAYTLCPRPWQRTEIDPVETPGVIASAEVEMQFFHKIAAIWNGTRGPWQAFPAFIELVYAGRVRDAETAATDHDREQPPVTRREVDDDDAVISIPFSRPAESDEERPHRRAA